MPQELRFVVDGHGLEFDSELAPEFPEWTRAHIDVVLPDPFTNLGWTIVGPAFEMTHRTLVSRRLAVMRRSKASTWRHIARIDGYAHINVSSARVMASRMPGVVPSKVDEEMGLAGLAPLTSKSWRDRIWYPVSVLGALRMPMLLPFDLWRQRRAVRALEAVDVAELDDAELVAFVGRAQARLVTVCMAHYLARLFATPAMEKLHALSPDADLAFGLLADLDGLEATAPTLALLDLAQEMTPDGEVDDRLIEEFLARFGHRGTSELDPGAAVWNDAPGDIRRRVRKLAEVDEESMLRRRRKVRADAERRLADVGWFTRFRLRQTAKACRSVSALGEQTKDQLVRAIHAVRLALQEASSRAGLPFDDAVLLSWDELAGVIIGDCNDVDLDVRRASFEQATRRAPALYRREDSGEQVRYPSSGTELRGIAASPGIAVGRSVVVSDPLDDVADGEILVAASTDTAWTHLFLSHDAVVTETGDLLSHSSIVARDLGIPAVVAVPEATTRLRTGETVTVDGHDGVVTTS